MVFSRLFKKGEGPREPESPEPASPEEESIPEGDTLEDWAARGNRSIRGGASTGSKRAEAIYGDATGMPTHFVRAAGCHVVTTEGETLVDCTMALGSVALGYAEPELTRAVIEALASGSVSGLSPALEVEVAERFCDVIPCAERVQFLKSGAEAVSAAVRIARSYTGRERVIGSGYFGWHDWSIDGAGVPEGTASLYLEVPFDDVVALDKAVREAGDTLAAIVLEPVQERMPSPEWAKRARELSEKVGAVLVFDEIKTGFRLATGGYQQQAGVIPDLAAFGKALANGLPLAAVCGDAELMSSVDKTWISSTLASETSALAAANAVLSWHERVDVCESLARIGAEMRETIGRAIEASEVSGVSVEGIDPMWFLRFDDAEQETRFLRAAVRHGVLFKRGPYNFPALAHDEEALADIESAASEAFVELREQAG